MSLVLISTVTVGAGGAASILFSSVPQTATDLFLVCSLRNTTTGVNFTAGNLRLNSTFAGAGRNLRGTGSAASSNTDTYILANAVGSTSNTFSNVSAYIPNYTSSVNKSASIDMVAENNATAGEQMIMAMPFAVTAAVTSVELQGFGTIAENSTASLYLITKGSGGATVS